MRTTNKEVYIAWDGTEFLDINECNDYERVNLNPIVQDHIYLHGSKLDNAGLSDELNLSEHAKQVFIGALYEVKFNVEVNRNTGETYCTHVFDTQLVKPVKIC